MKTEILVHITAPGTIQDDDRYRAIAQGVTDFQPATRMHLNSTDSLVSAEARHASGYPTHGWSECERNLDSQCAPSSSYLIETSREIECRNPSRPSQVAETHHGRHNTLLMSGLNGKTINPPYKNPLRPRVPSAGKCKTPEHPRCSDVGELSSVQVLVPFTGLPKSQEACSVSPPLKSNFETVLETPYTLVNASQTHPSVMEKKRGQDFASRCCQCTHLKRTSSQPSTAHTHVKKRKLDTDLQMKLWHSLEYLVCQTHPTYGSPQQHCSHQPPSSSGQHECTSLFEDVSTTTASVSQCLSSPCIAFEQKSIQRTETRRPSIIDLTRSQPDTASSEKVPPLRARPLSQVTPLESIVSKRVCILGRTLPVQIDAPDLQDGQDQTPIITKRMLVIERAIERVLGARNLFKPAAVCRDIGANERGYWKFAVNMRNNLQLTEVLPIKESITAGAASERDQVQTCVQWSEEEFISFWKDLSGFIQAGHAGWGVRLFIRKPDVQDNDTEENTAVELRVYCWGEVLAHMYMSLWLFSKRKISSASAQWISARDNIALITMPIGKDFHHRDCLRPWVRKGDSVKDSHWGVDGGTTARSISDDGCINLI